MKNIFSKIKIISTNKIAIALFVFVVLVLFSAKMVFAVWNGTFYEPGDTLNPECLPTDADCDVRSPLTSVNISDTAYDATTWDGVTTISPSKNAVRDQIETLVASNHNPLTIGTANGLSLATQVLSLALASTSTTGALSDTDWNTFNNKASALGADDNYVTDAQLVVVGNTSGTNSGDNAVNSLYSGLAASKQDALNGTGFVKATGTTISYDNSTYLDTGTASSTYLPLAGGTLTGLLSTSIDGNNAVTEFLQLTNSNEPTTGQVGDTASISFDFFGTINNGSSYAQTEVARIEAYKYGDFFHATALTDHDVGLKFYTMDGGTQRETASMSAPLGIGWFQLFYAGTIGPGFSATSSSAISATTSTIGNFASFSASNIYAKGGALRSQNSAATETYFYAGQAYTAVNSLSAYTWGNTATAISGLDTGLSRAAAGVVRIGSGASGTTDTGDLVMQDNIEFEGSAADDFETQFTVTNPTADRTITIPDLTGTLALTSDLGTYLPLAGGTLTGNLIVGVAPTASANYGTFSLGGGAFDGSTAGYFVGSASGTSLAVNEVSGYVGNLIDAQVGGVSKFSVDNTGGVRIGTTTTNTAGTIRYLNSDFQGYDGTSWKSLTNLASITGEATGFPNRTDTAISFNNGTRNFTITGTNFKVYSKGAEFTKNTESIEIPDVTGLYFIYYDATTQALSQSTSPWSLIDGTINIGTVYWNTSLATGLLGEERHGVTMDGNTHELLHNTVGSRYNTGFTGTFNSPPTFSVTAGSFYDEDIKNETLSTETTARVLYRTGASSTFTAEQVNYYHEVSDIIQYDNAGSLADVTNNNYVAYWIFATNDTITPIYSLMGQRQDTSLANARANNTYEGLSLSSLPFKEMKALYRIILRRSGTSETYQEIQDLRSISNLSSGTYLASNHSLLTGLTDDDHPQYLNINGRSGGQTVIGGTDATDILTIQNTSTTGTTLTNPAMYLKVGDSGGTTAMTILNNGNVGIGTTAPASRFHLGVAPTASANYGTLSLGGGAFDGSTSGYFVGSASGTSLAVNEVSGYVGNLLDAQVAGTSKFKVNNAGMATATAFVANNGATAAGTLQLFEDSDNGTNSVTLQGPASTADVTVTLPALTGTVALMGAATQSGDFYTSGNTFSVRSWIGTASGNGELYVRNASLQQLVYVSGANGGVYLPSTGAVRFSNSTTSWGGSDSGIDRFDVGVVGITNGSTGDGNLRMLSNIEFEGSAADTNETQLTVTNPTTDRTITIPDLTGTLATLENANTWSASQSLTAADSSALTDLLINPTAKTSGNLIDLQVASASKFYVSSAGNVFPAGEIYLGAGQGLSTLALGGTLILQGRNMNAATGAAAVRMGIGTHSPSSGTSIGVDVTPTINQTDTAATSVLRVSPYLQATGSGTQLLADFGTNTAGSGGGTHTSIFKFGTNGNLTLTGNVVNSNSGTGFYSGYSVSGTGNVNLIVAQGAARTNTSGAQAFFAVIPSYNQASGTAANTDLLINRTQTAVGSGAQLLIDAQVGSVSKFSVTNAGVVQQKGCTTAGALFADTSGNVICDPSRAEFKDNIVDLNNGLSSILALRPVSYTFKPEMNMGSETYFGFISGEVALIAPEFATYDAEGKPYGLDTKALLATTIKAIQEMNLSLEGIAGISIPVPGSPTESFVTAFFAKMGAWLADAGNGIANIFAKEVNTNTLCVSDDSGSKTCITKAQLDTLLSGAGSTATSTVPPVVVPTCTAPQTLVDNVCTDPAPETPTCTAPQTLVDNVCTDPTAVDPPVVEPPVCTAPQTLVGNVCTDPTPVAPTCIDPQILVDNVCTDPAPAPVIPPPEPTPPPVPDPVVEPIPTPAPDPVVETTP
ncbi:MAG: tail fiber domain-containing protein [Candidatus Paceibacterota bacterium]